MPATGTGPIARERCLVVTLGREACRCRTCYQELLKDRARQLADAAERGSAARAIALCLNVALATTRTTTAARKALVEWEGPAGIRDGAITLLDQLEGR